LVGLNVPKPSTQISIEKSLAKKNTPTFHNSNNLAKWWVTEGIARSTMNKPLTHATFPTDIPETWKLPHLEEAITNLYESEVKLLKLEFNNSLTNMEVDAGRKMRRDFTNLLLNGKFVETYELDFSDHSPNVIKWFKEEITKKQDEFSCLVTTIINDNASKIDSPVHDVCTDLGILHMRCVPHSCNLAFKDMFVCTHSVCVDLQRLFGIIGDMRKIIMNRKAPLKLFKLSQIQSGLKPKLLPRPGMTRWTALTRAMIRFAELMEHVVTVTTKSKWKISQVLPLVLSFIITRNIGISKELPRISTKCLSIQIIRLLSKQILVGLQELILSMIQDQNIVIFSFQIHGILYSLSSDAIRILSPCQSCMKLDLMILMGSQS
jgi:hypothetical protein